MKLTILSPFHDVHSYSIIYKVGQVVEFDSMRADRLIRLGLATETEPKAEVAEETVEVVEENHEPEVAETEAVANEAADDAKEENEVIFEPEVAEKRTRRRTAKN